MTLTVERLPNEPIIIATISGEVHEDTIIDMWRQSLELAKANGDQHFYRITNIQAITTTFRDFIHIVRRASMGIPGSSSDPNVTVVMVTHNHWAKSFVGAVEEEQFGALHIPVYDDMERALAYIRHEIEIAAHKNDRKSAESEGQKP
ncbi:MAG: hypothetical protein H7175_02915 [Burkholderiales bacterium]|nr:hypothetical protein [Anaerolineae bacterium]